MTANIHTLRDSPFETTQQFVQSYCSLTERTTEAPVEFAMWAGLYAASVAMGRNGKIAEGFYDIYPNVYILLIAPPGVATKSTVLRWANKALAGVPQLKARLGPNSGSWQGIINFMQGKQTSFDRDGKKAIGSFIALAISEFGTCFDGERDTVDFFTDVWDCPDRFFRTLVSRDIDLPFPTCSLFACTTPIWIQQNFGQHMQGGGFSSRCIFVYADKKARFVPRPSKLLSEKEASQLHQPYQNYLGKLCKVTGDSQLTPEADEMFATMYQDRIWKPASNQRAENYRARKAVHILKLAILYASGLNGPPVITTTHLQLAEAAIDRSETYMHNVLAATATNEHIRLKNVLVEYLRHKYKDGKWRSREALYKEVLSDDCGWEEYGRIIESAYRAGDIQLSKPPECREDKVRYRPKPEDGF